MENNRLESIVGADLEPESSRMTEIDEISEASTIWAKEGAERFLIADGYKLITEEPLKGDMTLWAGKV